VAGRIPDWPLDRGPYIGREDSQGLLLTSQDYRGLFGFDDGGEEIPELVVAFNWDGGVALDESAGIVEGFLNRIVGERGAIAAEVGLYVDLGLERVGRETHGSVDVSSLLKHAGPKSHGQLALGFAEGVLDDAVEDGRLENHQRVTHELGVASEPKVDRVA